MKLRLLARLSVCSMLIVGMWAAPARAVTFTWSATAETFGWFDRETPNGPPGFSPWMLFGGGLSGEAPDDAMDTAILSTTGKTTTLGTSVTVELVQITGQNATLQMNAGTLTTIDGFSILAGTGELAFTGGTVNNSDGPLTNAGFIRGISGTGTIGGDINHTGSVIVGGGATLNFTFNNATFSQSAGLFTVNAGGTANFNASGYRYDLTGGTLANNGLVSFGSSPAFRLDGGTLDNESTFRVQGGTFDYRSGTVLGGVTNYPVIIDGGTLALANLTGSPTGDFRMEGSATVEGSVPSGLNIFVAEQSTNFTGAQNSGNIVLAPDVLSNVTATFSNTSGMTNLGLIRAENGVGGQRRFSGDLNNQGSVIVETLAELVAFDDITNTEIFTIQANGLFRYGSGDSFTHTGGIVTNNGKFQTDGGTFTYDGGAINGNAIQINGGTLNLNVPLATDAADLGHADFTFTAPGTLSGNVHEVSTVTVDAVGGTVTVNAVGTIVENEGDLVLTGTSATGNATLNVLSTNGLRNAGTFRAALVPASTNDRRLNGSSSAVFINESTGDLIVEQDVQLTVNLDIANAGDVDIGPGGSMLVGSSDSFDMDDGTLNNNGLVKFSGSSGPSIFRYRGGMITGNAIEFNTGQLEIDGGIGPATFRFTGGTNNQHTGDIAAGQVVVVDATTANTTVSRGTQFNVNNSFTNAGTIRLTGASVGSARFNLAGITSVLTNSGLIHAEGLVGSSNIRQLSGANGGQIISSGQINVDPDTTLEVGLSVVNTGDVTIGANATLNIINPGAVVTQNSGTITNNGTFRADDFTYNGGTITGNSIEVVASRLTLAPGTGAASFIINGTGTLAGDVNAGQSVELRNETSNNIVIVTPGPVTNDGSIIHGGDGTGSNLLRIGPLFANLNLTNNGTYIARNDNVTGAGGVRGISGELDNFGTAIVEPDANYQGLRTTNRADFTVQPGGTVELGQGRAFTQEAGTLTNNGSMNLIGASFNYDGGDITGNPINLDTGTLVFGPDVTGGGEFRLVDGGNLGGTISANATVRLVGPASGSLVINPGTPPGPTTNRGLLEFDAAAGGIVQLFGSGQTINDVTGTITGTGQLGFSLSQGTVINRGRIAPGDDATDPAGLIEVAGDFIQEGTGVLDIQLGGSNPDEFDRLTGNKIAQIAGTLDVSLFGGLILGSGDMFTILSATGGVSGTFATTASELPALDPGLAWQIDYNANDVVLSVIVSAGVPGDYNNDGTVNAADYVVWRDNLGAPTGALPNDTDGGVIGQAQYDTWKANFGMNAPSNGSAQDAPVPEPSSWLLLMGLVAIGIRGRHHCRE